MDPQNLEVPLWFLKIVTGAAVTSLLGGLGGVILLVRKVDTLNQMLVGPDGQNGIRGSLRHLNRKHDELSTEVREQGRIVGRIEERVDDCRTRLGGLEHRDHERGMSA